MDLLVSMATEAALGRHGEREYPRECCGFLLGRTERSGMEIHEIRNAENRDPGSGKSGFLISPRACLVAGNEAAARGLEVLGFYHSHPDAPAVPSARDREEGLPGALWVILPVRGGVAAAMRGWVLAADGGEFEELTVRRVIEIPEH